MRRHLLPPFASSPECAAETVAELGDIDAVPLLEAMLASESDSVVSAGARALATLGSPDALAKLHEALRSERKRRLEAIEGAIQTLSEE